MIASARAFVGLTILALLLASCQSLPREGATPTAAFPPTATGQRTATLVPATATAPTAAITASPMPPATNTLTPTVTQAAEPDLPVILDPGSPPSNRCVAVHPGGTAVVTAYLGPSTAFAPVARLGNWAEVLNGENGWYQIQIGPGQTGWIRETDVGLVGPCEGLNVPVRLEIPAGGSPWLTVGSILPGQADRYVFQAEAGTRVLIDLNSTGQVNFALYGVGDGQPYKRIVNEDRTWEGVLPNTQDYMLTVVTAGEAADYELLIASIAAPPFAVFYDAHTGAVLGGFQDAFWVDAEEAASALLGGERYQIFYLAESFGEATGSAALDIGGICPGYTVQLTPQPEAPTALAVAGAAWDVAARPAAPIELTRDERQALADLLFRQGLTVDAAGLQLGEALAVDLFGDGSDEIVVTLSQLKAGGTLPAVDAGDYSAVAVLMDIDGRLHAEPLILDTYAQANDLAYPWRYELSGLLDLNGDGTLEVIVAGWRWEGASTVAFGIGPAAGASPLLERSCAE